MVSSLARFRHRLKEPTESVKKCVYKEHSKDTTRDEKFPHFCKDLYFSVFEAPPNVKDRRVDDDRESDPEYFFHYASHLGSGRLGKSYIADRRDLTPYSSTHVPKKDPKLKVVITKMDARKVDYVDALRALEPFIFKGKEVSPFITKVLLSFRSRLPYTLEHYYLVSEYWPAAVSLCKHVQRLGCLCEEDARFYLMELVEAIVCVHHFGKILRRLSICSLLIDPMGHIKLTPYTMCDQNLDCGQSCNMLVKNCGDQFYASPEVVFGVDVQFATDWWSFGVIMYQMLTGELPFNGRTLGELGKSITECPLVIPEYVSGEASALLKHLLHKDPRRRLGFSDSGTVGEPGSVEVKNHPFFQRVLWRDINNYMLDPPFKPGGYYQATEEIYRKRSQLAQEAAKAKAKGTAKS